MVNDIKIIVDKCEKECLEQFKYIDELCLYNSEKVLNAFRNNQISESHFNTSTGYGYNDIGRDAIEKVFKEVLDSEDALVRN